MTKTNTLRCEQCRVITSVLDCDWINIKGLDTFNCYKNKKVITTQFRADDPTIRSLSFCNTTCMIDYIDDLRKQIDEEKD